MMVVTCSTNPGGGWISQCTLHEINRGCVVMTAHEDIIHCWEDDHASEHDDAPIHCGSVDCRREREESKDEQWQKEAESGDINGHTPASQRPATGWQRLSSESFEKKTTNWDNVGGHQGGNCKRDDCIQCHSWTDVDQRKKNSDRKRAQDRVQWNIPSRGDLYVWKDRKS